MAKLFNKANAASQDDEKKNRKKQARHQEKLAQQIILAKKELKKHEQKIAKAQSNLEASKALLHELEDKLAQLQPVQSVETPHQDEAAITASHPSSPDPTEGDSALATTSEESTLAEDEDVPTEVDLSPAPAEGSDDFPHEEPEKTEQTDGAVEQSFPVPLNGRANVVSEEATSIEHEEKAEEVSELTSLPPAEGRADIEEPSTANEHETSEEPPAENSHKTPRRTTRRKTSPQS